ncbi:hypothetical protein HELRODRAFT_170052 [Helobdella robusta]|uniref:Uncharacterized protein n=1 Tax=Helobdella robusta TaxID=6412 RepID=T1F2L2_HELRO|nr:hypothetical protein HELRODRAFT_170052 [Helobdella robusta]ESO07513.1 hypothetical protein HELRODRAFT_170052 [Helobdella robusta]
MPFWNLSLFVGSSSRGSPETDPYISVSTAILYSCCTPGFWITFVLLISACMLSSQLSNLETMFHNIVDENNQHHQLLYQQRRNFNGDGGDEGVEEGEADGLAVDDNCKQRESSMAVIRELSTMHYHLLTQVVVTFSALFMFIVLVQLFIFIRRFIEIHSISDQQDIKSPANHYNI